MSNHNKRLSGNITTTQTLPASTTGTGSDLTLTSGSDIFTLDVAISDAQFKAGAWVYDNSNSEKYKIKEVAPNGLSGRIWGLAEDNVTLADVEYVKASDAKNIKIWVKFVDAGTMDGVSWAAGDTVNLDTINENAKFGERWVEPAIMTGTSTNYIIKKY